MQLRQMSCVKHPRTSNLMDTKSRLVPKSVSKSSPSNVIRNTSPIHSLTIRIGSYPIVVSEDIRSLSFLSAPDQGIASVSEMKRFNHLLLCWLSLATNRAKIRQFWGHGYHFITTPKIQLHLQLGPKTTGSWSWFGFEIQQWSATRRFTPILNIMKPKNETICCLFNSMYISMGYRFNSQFLQFHWISIHCWQLIYVPWACIYTAWRGTWAWISLPKRKIIQFIFKVIIVSSKITNPCIGQLLLKFFISFVTTISSGFEICAATRSSLANTGVAFLLFFIFGVGGRRRPAWWSLQLLKYRASAEGSPPWSFVSFHNLSRRLDFGF